MPGQVTEHRPRELTAEFDQISVPFAVHCSDTLLRQILDYAIRFKHTEVFGLLLGEVVRTPSAKTRTIVRDFVPATRLQKSTATFVEVSAEELIRMDHALEDAVQNQGLVK